MDEKNVCDRAADKLRQQINDAKQDKNLKGFESTAIKCLCEPIGNMLIKFCYQNEEFALAVERFDKPLIEALKDIAKMSTKDKPMISDVEAYAKAVKFYLPAGEIICSFRVNLPEERDDDLLDLEVTEAQNRTGGAMNLTSMPCVNEAIILDVFGVGEI